MLAYIPKTNFHAGIDDSYRENVDEICGYKRNQREVVFISVTLSKHTDNY